MFFIEEHGNGWKVVEVPSPLHSSYAFMKAYTSKEEARRVMMTKYYEWEDEVYDFALKNNLPLCYRDVKEEMKNRMA